jgi:four helix bundle protein
VKGEGRAIFENGKLMNDLKPRTKKFALDVILYSRKLPRGDEFMVIKRQLIRSATSVAANYRATQRAKSKADFINKLGTVEEEADESLSGWNVLLNWQQKNTRN